MMNEKKAKECLQGYIDILEGIKTNKIEIKEPQKKSEFYEVFLNSKNNLEYLIDNGYFSKN